MRWPIGLAGGFTYIAGVFEHTAAGASTSTYAGSVMRRVGYASGNGVFTVLADHLGSTSAMVDATGAVVAQQYYYPYGANRGGAQSDLTERRYTGQYHETGLAGTEGLYDYNARWWRWPQANAKRIRGAAAADPPMTPALGRFVQADTIVPSPRSPQSLNRYAYVLGNPLKYVDPTGHIVNHYREIIAAAEIVISLRSYDASINQDWGFGAGTDGASSGGWDEGSWTISDLGAALRGVEALADALGGREAFAERVGPVHIARVRGNRSVGGKQVYGLAYRIGPLDKVGRILLYDAAFTDGDWKAEYTVVHELAHVWDSRPGEYGSEFIDQMVPMPDEPWPTQNSSASPKEHWADLVEVAIYPDCAKKISELGPLHRGYLALAIQGWY